MSNVLLHFVNIPSLLFPSDTASYLSLGGPTTNHSDDELCSSVTLCHIPTRAFWVQMGWLWGSDYQASHHPQILRWPPFFLHFWNIIGQRAHSSIGKLVQSFANVTDLKLHQELVKGSAHCTQAQNNPKYLLFRKTPLRNSGVRTTQRMSQSTFNNKEMFYSKVFVVNEHKRNPYPTLKRTVQRGKQTSYPPPECKEVEKQQG